jgi:hypothetical protein
MKKIFLLNLLIFFVLMALFIAAGFAMGYAADKRFGSDAAILFVLVVLVHLFLNYLVLLRQKMATAKSIAISCLVILAVYALVLFH